GLSCPDRSHSRRVVEPPARNDPEAKPTPRALDQTASPWWYMNHGYSRAGPDPPRRGRIGRHPEDSSARTRSVRSALVPSNGSTVYLNETGFGPIQAGPFPPDAGLVRAEYTEPSRRGDIPR